jgi:hypothetical protein
LDSAIRVNFFVWCIGYFIWERKKPEIIFDKAINEIYGDDFSGV